MTKEYTKWVEWEKQQKYPAKPLTRTQKEFAEYVLGNEELIQMLIHPGDLMSIMQRVQKYLKDK